MITATLDYGMKPRAKLRTIDGARKYLIHWFEEVGGLVVVTSMVGNHSHHMLNLDEFRGFTKFRVRRSSCRLVKAVPGLSRGGRQIRSSCHGTGWCLQDRDEVHLVAYLFASGPGDPVRVAQEEIIEGTSIVSAVNGSPDDGSAVPVGTVPFRTHAAEQDRGSPNDTLTPNRSTGRMGTMAATGWIQSRPGQVNRTTVS